MRPTPRARRGVEPSTGGCDLRDLFHNDRLGPEASIYIFELTRRGSNPMRHIHVQSSLQRSQKMLMQLKHQGSGLRRAAGQWAATVLCGSIVAACSGTIDTPTDENPPRRAERTQAPAAAAPAPRTPAPRVNEEEEDDATALPPPAAAVTPADPPAPEEEDPPPAADGDLSFASDIWPIFNGSCGPCHVSGGSAGRNFGDPDVDQAFEDSEDFEARVLAAIEAGSMPLSCGGGDPGSSGCLSVADAAAIEAWYEAGAPE
jgi:mono/diheme cytochrome c family protein